MKETKYYCDLCEAECSDGWYEMTIRIWGEIEVNKDACNKCRLEIGNKIKKILKSKNIPISPY